MHNLKILLTLITIIHFGVSYIPPATAGDGTKENPLRVAIIVEEPFGIRSEDGYYGVAADLWKQIAAENLWNYEFYDHHPEEYSDLIKKLEDNTYDVLVGPTTSAAALEKVIDFSRPYYLDYIGSIVKVSLFHTILGLIETFIYSVGALLIILLLVFAIHIHTIWFFERHKNEGIPNDYFEGIRFVLWASLTRQHYISHPIKNVTLPQSFPVRFSLILWIVMTYFLSTLISGTVVSFMTVSLSKANTGIVSINQLKGEVLGAIDGSVAYILGQRQGLKMKKLDDFDQGLLELEEETIAAFLTNHSTALYKLQESLNPRLRLSPMVLRYSLYGISFPQGSPLKEPFNKTLIEFQDDGTLVRICKEYMPESVKNCQL